MSESSAREASTPRRQPEQRRSRQRVESILDAAAELIAQSGVDATSMSDVADRAGIRLPSVYRYFPNKQAILQTLLERYSGIVREEVVAVLAPVSTQEQARAAVSTVDARLLGPVPQRRDVRRGVDGGQRRPGHGGRRRDRQPRRRARSWRSVPGRRPRLGRRRPRPALLRRRAPGRHRGAARRAPVGRRGRGGHRRDDRPGAARAARPADGCPPSRRSRYPPRPRRTARAPRITSGGVGPASSSWVSRMLTAALRSCRAGTTCAAVPVPPTQP